MVPQDPLPKITEQSPQYSTYKPSAEFTVPISKSGPGVFQSNAEPPCPSPRVTLKSVPAQCSLVYPKTQHCVLWRLRLLLQAALLFGLQLFNVHFKGEHIAYEIGVQEVMVLYRGHTAEGRVTKNMDVGWGLGGISGCRR